MATARIIVDAPRISASFARIQPGWLLTHPATGKAIARVVDVKNSAKETVGKPTRYTMTIVAEAFEE